MYLYFYVFHLEKEAQKEAEPKPDPDWYCAVHLKNGVKAKTTELMIAHNALGSSGNQNNLQAIIPIVKTKAGDPHTLHKSWEGGSMWWHGWPDINKMQATCEAAGLPGLIIHMNQIVCFKPRSSSEYFDLIW